MKKFLLSSTLLVSLFIAPSAWAGQDMIYHDGETELQGYWVDAECPAREKAPVVMIVHQWKGLGSYEKGRAEQLAHYCYNAFAVDMYGKDIRPSTKEEAAAEAGKYKKDPALARRRMKAALDAVREKAGNVRIAVLGYCFGGTMALELARSGAAIDGVVSFHGGLATPDPVTTPGIIKASIQVHHGADDPHVTQQEVENFMKEMDEAKADWTLTQYAGAVHAFTEKEAGNDPSTGAAYNEKADQRSWAATQLFLSEIFAVPPQD